MCFSGCGRLVGDRRMHEAGCSSFALATQIPGDEHECVSIRRLTVYSAGYRGLTLHGSQNAGQTMTMQDDYGDEQPRPQGMTSTAKVLVVLGSIFGILLLACCGGLVFVGWKFQGVARSIAKNFTTTNPQDIRARTAEIVHIDIPEEFEPLQAFD